MSMNKKKMVWARVSENVRELIDKLAGSQGISRSEYLRQLVIADLDHRSIFTTKLKDEQ